MAATTAVIIGTAGNLIIGNQIRQKEKGLISAATTLPPLPPAPPPLSQTYAQNIAAAQAKAKAASSGANKNGYAGTILTTPAQNAAPVMVNRKTLLGQ